MESTVGDIALHAVEQSQINAASAAASIALANAMVGVAVSGAGAEASNVILTRTNAYIQGRRHHPARAMWDVAAESLSAAPVPGVLLGTVVGGADDFAQKLDDAGTTDADKEDGGDNEREVDIAADESFLALLSGILASQGTPNSGDLAVTMRTEGLEWSVTDRVTGYSYTITRDGEDFKVATPTIGAAVVSASVALAGGGVGVGVSIGVSFATNLIGWDLLDISSTYTTASEPPSISNGQTVKILEGRQRRLCLRVQGLRTLGAPGRRNIGQPPNPGLRQHRSVGAGQP